MSKIDLELKYIGNGIFQAADVEYCESVLKPNDMAIFRYVKWTANKARTLRQNSSLYLWFTNIAKYCQAAGIEITKIMPKKLEHPVTEENFKADVFNPCCEALYGHIKSSKLEKEQLSRLVLEIDNRLLMPQGIDVEFPNNERLGA